MKKLVESLVKSIIEEVNKDYTIYFDLDDTLSNYTKNLRTSIYTDPETGEKRPFASKDTANDFDFWVRAELLPGVKEMVKFAQQNFNTVKILSAVPTLSKAKQEETGETYYKAPIEGKTKWLTNNGFSLPAIWTSSGTAKRAYATPMTVLVDDKEENIKAFEKAGGKGILFTNAQDVIQKLKDILNPEITTKVEEKIDNKDLADIDKVADKALETDVIFNKGIDNHFVKQANERGVSKQDLIDFFQELGKSKDEFKDEFEDLITKHKIKKTKEKPAIVAKDEISGFSIPFVSDDIAKMLATTVLAPGMKPRKGDGVFPFFEQVQGDSIVCDNCGWTWKIEDGGDDLYICHKCGHDNTPKDNNKFFEPLNGEDTPQLESKPQGLENDPEFKKLLVSLTMYMMDHINIEPLPDINFIEDDVKNADDFFGKTAYYDPNAKSITLYTLNRHPKDILRSYAHEMIHHKQNLEGKLNNIEGHNINEDDYLKELEREAYEYGNGLLFRGWENSIKGND